MPLLFDYKFTFRESFNDSRGFIFTTHLYYPQVTIFHIYHTYTMKPKEVHNFGINI